MQQEHKKNHKKRNGNWQWLRNTIAQRHSAANGNPVVGPKFGHFELTSDDRKLALFLSCFEFVLKNAVD